MNEGKAERRCEVLKEKLKGNCQEFYPIRNSLM